MVPNISDFGDLRSLIKWSNLTDTEMGVSVTTYIAWWFYLLLRAVFLGWRFGDPESHMKMWFFFWRKSITFQGTNISPKNGILEMIFLFPRWDMLIPWRVYFIIFSTYAKLMMYTYPEYCIQIPVLGPRTNFKHPFQKSTALWKKMARFPNHWVRG